MIRKALFLSTVLLLTSFTVSCDSAESDQLRDQPNPVLLISIDGFMNEYIERNETPNFDRFLANGVQAEHLIPVFPTKTFPTHWSIATGLYTENHGIIANSFYDFELEARFSFGPPDSTPNDERWWGGEPIWITAEKQGLTSATFFWPGSEATISGMQSTRWVDYDGSVPDSTRIDSVMAWMNPGGDVQADFGTLYFSFVDSRGHAYGPNSAEVDQAVIEMDGLLGYLLDSIDENNLGNRINIILTSDHGMAELSDEKIIYLDDIIDLQNVEIIDWTPVALIKPNEGKTDEVYNAIKQNEENYRVYLREELPERFHFRNHYRIPEIIMIADIGYSITSRPFFESRGINAATHGYDNLEPEMLTFFAANGPDFKTGVRVPEFESVHIYELMAHLLNLTPAPNDGSLEEVRNLLREE